MKRLLAHFVEKLFATKINTPARKSLKDVANDIELMKMQYDKLGMKLIDIKYKECVSNVDEKHEDGSIWHFQYYLTYATLYFVKG